LRYLSKKFPESYLILSIPSPKRWKRKKDKGDYPPHHLTRWGEKSLRKLFNKTGYKVIKIIYPKLTAEDIKNSSFDKGFKIGKFSLPCLLYAFFLNLLGYRAYSLVIIGYKYK